jgi:UDP-glucose 4-epimerase
MNKNILLVGGCGYIGTFLYSKLLDSDCSVVVCDNLRRSNPLKVDVINKDYADLNELELINYDAVLWFAGHSSVPISTIDPEGAIKNNCLNIWKLQKNVVSLY